MISYVIPVFNEEESILHFYQELTKHAKRLSEAFEIIFVDDGSQDKTLEFLKELEKKDKNVKVYSFRRNHGKAEALTFGFQKARGDLIITMDADLQDRPSEIINLHDYNCGLKLYTRDAAKSLNLYGGMHRFIPLLLAEAGFKVSEVPVIHDVRRYGISKYSAWKVLTQMPDMMTMLFLSKYAKRPLHFFGFIGAILFGLGILISIYLSILHFLGEAIGTRPLLT